MTAPANTVWKSRGASCSINIVGPSLCHKFANAFILQPHLLDSLHWRSLNSLCLACSCFGTTGQGKIVCPIEITLFDNICILYQKQQNVNKTLSNIAISNRCNTGATKVQQFAPFFAQNRLESRFKLVSDLTKGCFWKITYLLEKRRKHANIAENSV